MYTVMEAGGCIDGIDKIQVGNTGTNVLGQDTHHCLHSEWALDPNV